LCSHYQLAIDCYTDCLQGAKSLDRSETNTAIVLQKMGELQMNKLKIPEEAKKKFLDALDILRCLEDNDDDDCQRSQHIINLLLLIAQASALAKDYENALDYYEEHISMVESDIPTNEDLIADSLHAMGSILSTMDENPDYELAIIKLTECVDIKKKIFGSDDEGVANVMYTLSTVYEKAGYHEKATESLTEVLRSFKMKKNKVGIVKVYSALARLKSLKAAELDSGLERSAAIECYKEALKVRRQIMSLDDMDLASILYEYAHLVCMNNEHNIALPLLEEALRIQKTKNGLKDERVAVILLKMAEVYCKQKKYDASLVSLEQVLFIQSSLGHQDGAKDNIDLGLCRYLLATTYLARDECQKAISSYMACLTIRQQKFGHNSLECAVVHNDLGDAYRKVGDFDKAIESLVEALKIRKTGLGNNSLDYGHSVFNLASEFNLEPPRACPRDDMAYTRHVVSYLTCAYFINNPFFDCLTSRSPYRYGETRSGTELFRRGRQSV
jgi:tetratricopeptide (TPR) repeat protein